MLSLQNSAVEIVSIHHYAAPDACFFQANNCANASLVVIAASAVAPKLLFVGEYGGNNPKFTGPLPADQLFNRQLLDFQVASARASPATGDFRLSAIWAWECPSHRNDMVCIYPKSNRPLEQGSDVMLALIQAANSKLSAQEHRET
jgi:hypothetical protein